MEYTSSLSGRLRAVVVALVVGGVVGVGAALIVVELGVSTRERPLLLLIGSAVAIVVFLAMVIWIFFIATVTIRTSPTHVEVLRRGAVRERWERSEAQFSSFVIRESTNGVPTNSLRKLIVTTAGSRVEVLCRWFDARTFNALIADVAPLVPADPRLVAPALVTTGHFEIARTTGRMAARVVGVVVAIAVLAVIAILAVPEIDARIDPLPIVIPFALLVAAIILVPLLASERGIPRLVTVSQSGLRFDDREFAMGQLTGIRATAPGPGYNRRSIALTESTGRTTVIRLGLASGRAFPQYAEFIEAIRGATAHRPGLFTLDVA